MGKNILIVENDQDLCKQIQERLLADAFNTNAASDGLEALKIIKSKIPDLVLTEVEMPNMDGVDLFQALKKDTATVKIPIIIMTEKAHLEEGFRKLGVNGFVAKPLNHDSLVGQINTCLCVPKAAAATPAPVPASTPPPTPTPTPAPAVKAPEKPAAIQGQGTKKVLIAESVEAFIKQISDCVQPQASEIGVVNRESDVITKVKQFQPDVLIMNILLKALPTNNVIRYLRRQKEFKNLPIIVFSAADQSSFEDVSSYQIKLLSQSARVHCVDAGATLFIANLDPATFYSQVEKYFE